MRKLILLFIAVLFTAVAFAQNGLSERQEGDLVQSVSPHRSAEDFSIPPSQLLIRRNARYSIGGEMISRRELLQEIAPAIPGLAEEIRKGVAMKWTAIGLGILTPLCLGAGVMVSVFAVMIKSDPVALLGIGMMFLSPAMLGGSIALGILSVKVQNKAMRLYNDTMLGVGGANVPTLSLAPTRGGLGVQLTF